MTDKFIVQRKHATKPMHNTPITAAQLQLIAAKTERELEERQRNKAAGNTQPDNGREVITEWL